jgi:hypothetical protein
MHDAGQAQELYTPYRDCSKNGPQSSIELIDTHNDLRKCQRDQDMRASIQALASLGHPNTPAELSVYVGSSWPSIDLQLQQLRLQSYATLSV